jgi:titin
VTSDPKVEPPTDCVEATTTTCEFTGLVSGTAYTFTVVAANEFGTGVASAPSEPIIPATPTAPDIERIDPGIEGLSVKFSAGGDNGHRIVGYDYSLDDGETWVPRSQSVTTSPLTVSDLAAGSTHVVRIRAVNAVGVGVPSDAVTASVANAPGPPTNVVATAGVTSATVSWTAPDQTGIPPVINYVVRSDPKTLSIQTWCLNEVITTCEFRGLEPGKPYTFSVAAINSEGSSGWSAPSNSVIAKAVPDVPSAPTSVSARPAKGSIIVGWSAPTSDGGEPITEYRAFARFKADPNNQFLTESCSSTAVPPASPQLTCTISGLFDDSTYVVTVTARNSVGVSPETGPIEVVPADVPVMGSVRAEAGNKQIEISFFTFASDSTAPVTNVEYSLDNGSTWIPRDPASISSPLTITGLTNGTTYTAVMRAVNRVGSSTVSSPVSATPVDPAAVSTPTPTPVVTVPASSGTTTTTGTSRTAGTSTPVSTSSLAATGAGGMWTFPAGLLLILAGSILIITTRPQAAPAPVPPHGVQF